MKILKPAIVCLLLIIALGGVAQAQNTCANIDRSIADQVRVRSTLGVPGDTIYMPVSLANDSAVTAFQFLIQFDTTWLTPIMKDPTFLDYRVPDGNRFQRLDTLIDNNGFDSIVDVTQFTAVFFNEYFETKEDIIACNFIPQRTDDLGNLVVDTLPGGTDAIFELAFEVDPDMPHNTDAIFEFYTYEVIAFIDDEIFPPDTTWANACATAQMTTVWNMEVVGFPDSTNKQIFQIYPEPIYGVFRADTGYVPSEDPAIVSFSANPSTIYQGNSSTLSWEAVNANSVIVELVGGAEVTNTTNLNSSINVAPSALGDHQYRITAYGDDSKTASATTTVTVQEVGGGGTAPTITFTPTQSSYSLNQGETVSFDVTATSTPYSASETVSLTVGSLANNMTFTGSPTVSGAGSVTGTFSFTPDFNQSGAFSVSFSAIDADNLPGNAAVVFDVQEILYDRLFSTSAEGQKPVGGLPGAEAVYFPINLITSKTVYGVQFDMSYPYDLLTVDSFVTTGRIPEWVVYENVGQVPGDIKVVTFGLANEPVEMDTTSAIMYAVMTIDSAAVPWSTQTIRIENGRESVSPDPNVPSLPLVTDTGIVEIDNYGDVNLDKFVDVGDAVNIVAYVIGNYGLTPRQFATADVIISDTVNVYDLIGVVNLIYGIPLAPQGSPAMGSPAVVGLDYNDLIDGGADVLTVTSDLPEQIAGVELEVAYDPNSVTLGKPSLTEDNQKFALSYKDNGAGSMKVLLYHMAPFKSDELIQIGAADLVEIPIVAHGDVASGDQSKIRLTRALLSTSSAQAVEVEGINPLVPGSFTLHQNYPNPFNPTTTISFTVGTVGGGLAAQNVTLDVFNILGQKVLTLLEGEYPAGEHQIEWNATDNNGQRVATGIYLYRLKVGDESQTKKMLFLK